jgi:hypothetical protein
VTSSGREPHPMSADAARRADHKDLHRPPLDAS